ncbi:MAG: exported protein of unknown function [Bacillota bacterium]|nr:exported protein of unknown function [Bacillota bacterium]
MKKINDLLNDYDIIDENLNIKEDSMSEIEKLRIKNLTLEKLGLTNKKSTKKRLILPLAAAMTLVLSFAVVFAQGGISNVYYKLFGENIKYVNEIGTEINKEYSNNGITLNVANMLGDENSFYIIFELINESGESFENINYIEFEDLNLDFNSSGGYTYYKIEDDNEKDNKATFVLIGNTAKKAVNKKMTLKINNFAEYSIIELDKFEPFNFLSENEEFIKQSLTKNTKKSLTPITSDMLEEEKQKIEYMNSLIPNEILPFKQENIILDDNNHISVDNIGFAEGRLCIRFAVNTLNTDEYISELYFVNKNNPDDILYGDILFTDSDWNNIYDYYSFNIKNMEELKNYDFKYSIMKETKNTEGNWDVSFKADYKNSSKKINVNKEVELEGKRYKIENVKLSPISLNVELKNNLIDNIDNPQHNNILDEVSVVLKDGSNIKSISSGSSSNAFSASINMIFEKPVDVLTIDYIKIGDIKVYFND